MTLGGTPAPTVGGGFVRLGRHLHQRTALVGFEGGEADAGTVVPGRLQGGRQRLEDRFFINNSLPTSL